MTALPTRLLSAADAIPEIAGLLREAAEVITAISVVNKHHNLGDAIYDVRARIYDDDPGYKGNSWEHPNVAEYSHAVEVVEKATAAQEQSDE